MHHELRVSLLGPPTIAFRGEPVALPAGKARALLWYLAAHPGQRISRQHLTALLWEGYPEASARHSLRSLLTRLRALLPVWPFRVDNAGIEWPVDPVSQSKALDTGLFLSLSAVGGDDETTALATAVALWRGPFLADVSVEDSEAYEEWLQTERALWERRLLAALDRLATLAEASGRWGDALEAAERCLALDPYHERMHRTAMRAHAALGNRAAALAEHRQFRRRLMEELGAAPDAATIALAETIAASDLAAVTIGSSPSASDTPTPTNVPRRLTRFVGRVAEVASVQRLLSADPGVQRFVTLVGQPGVGKTRLALELADARRQLHLHPDGIWLVELANVVDGSQVPGAIATAAGIRDASDRPTIETLVDQLRHRRVLLVLDNCEHVVDAAAQAVHALLVGCPRLVVLATSREPLGVTGEAVWEVPPLPVPGPAVGAASLDEIGGHDAVILLVDRAQAVDPGFELTEHNARAAAELCRRLDGNPHALELAAARLNTLSADDLLLRLDDRFRLLANGSRTALPRQQTLRAMMDWSWDLLSDVDRRVLARLAAFTGGWSLDAAEAVCSGNGDDVLTALTRLVARSLVAVDRRPAGRRYRLLETVREYARERLEESGEADVVRRRHLAWCLEMAQAAEPDVWGAGGNQVAALDRLQTEADNLRAALAWAVGNDPTGGAELAATLLQYWRIRGDQADGELWVGALGPRVATQTRSWARVRMAAGILARDRGDLAAAVELTESALSYFRETGDRWAIGLCLSNLGIVAEIELDHARAELLFDEALATHTAVGNRWGIGTITYRLANLRLTARRYREAGLLYEQAIAVHAAIGDKRGAAIALHRLCDVHWILDEREALRARALESRVLANEIGGREGAYMALVSDIHLARLDERHARLRALNQRALELVRELPRRIAYPDHILFEALCSSAEGDHARATRLLAAAAAGRAVWRPHSCADDHRGYDRVLLAARRALGPADFAVAWADGAAMTLDQALVAASTVETPAPNPQLQITV